MVRVRLVTLPPEEYARWRARIVVEYAADHVRAGNWTADEAPAKAEAEVQELLPQGTATPDHYVCAVEDVDSGTHVGLVWFHAPPASPGRSSEVFVYALETYEPFRGRGYAAAAMGEVEQRARALGFDTVALHVFGGNRAAIALYEKLGYSPTNLRMAKRVAPEGSPAGRDVGSP